MQEREPNERVVAVTLRSNERFQEGENSAEGACLANVSKIGKVEG